MAGRTIATLLSEVRTLIQDKDPQPYYRYSDLELLEAFNGALAEARSKRPDLFTNMKHPKGAAVSSSKKATIK